MIVIQTEQQVKETSSTTESAVSTPLHHHHEQTCSSSHARQEQQQQQEQEQEQRSQWGISFSPTILVIPHFHCSEYTDEERNACWYSPNDAFQIQRENRDTIELIKKSKHQQQQQQQQNNNNDNVNPQVYCGRGLEAKTCPITRQRFQNRKRARQLVLENVNTRDEYELAQVYKEYSYQHKKAAYMMGIQDAKMARMVHAASSTITSTNTTPTPTPTIRFNQQRCCWSVKNNANENDEDDVVSLRSLVTLVA